MKRNLTNHECVVYMMKLEEFTNRGNSIFGYKNYWVDGSVPITFTVYSYGQHFPMYVYDYDAQRWYGNRDKYSRTTSKHQGLMRPPIVEAWYSTSDLQVISARGIVRAVERRMIA